MKTIKEVKASNTFVDSRGARLPAVHFITPVKTGLDELYDTSRILEFVEGLVDVEQSPQSNEIPGALKYPMECISEHKGSVWDMCALTVSLFRGVGYDAWYVIGKLMRPFVSEAHLEESEREQNMLSCITGGYSAIGRPGSPPKSDHPCETLTCWVFVKSGSRGVTHDALFDPLTGESIDPASVVSIMLLFNENNTLEPKESVVAKHDWSAFTIASYMRIERSSAHQLQIAESLARNTFPNGVRTSFHQYAIRTRYTKYQQPDGLIESVSRFSDLRRSHLRYTYDIYEGRSDKLTERLRFGGGSVLEEFTSGRVDHVVRILMDLSSATRMIEFRPDYRSDSLLKASNTGTDVSSKWVFHYNHLRRNDSLVLSEYASGELILYYCKPKKDRTYWVDPKSLGILYKSFKFPALLAKDHIVEAVTHFGLSDTLTEAEWETSKCLKFDALEMIASTITDFERIIHQRGTEEVGISILRHPLDEIPANATSTPVKIEPKMSPPTQAYGVDITQLLGDGISDLSPLGMKEEVVKRLEPIKAELQKNLNDAQTLFHQNKVRMQAKGNTASEEDRVAFETQQSMVWFRITLIEKRLAQHQAYSERIFAQM